MMTPRPKALLYRTEGPRGVCSDDSSRLLAGAE